MKLIRWWGIAAFIIIIFLALVSWYLLAPKIIQNTIQQVGSEALGAQVEVKKVELSLFPVAITLNHLSAADPELPMTNLFESSKIKFSIDSELLLWKKVMIEELVINGIKTGTQRQSSGALKNGRKSTKLLENTIEMIIPDVKDINIKTLIEKADLITLKRIEQLKIKQSEISNEWKLALDKDAFNRRLDKIKKESKRLSDRAKKNKLNLLTDRKDWKKLKKAINTERQLISTLSNQLKQDKNTLSKQLKLVKNGPSDDLNLVMQQFGLNNGVDGLVNQYLGPQYTPWIKRILDIIKGIKPKNETNHLEDKQKIVQVGKKIYFKDQKVFPEILIKKIKLNGHDNQWKFDGNGFDLGYLPWLTGKPAKLDLAINGKGSAKLNVSSHWKSTNEMLTQINSNVKAWPIKKMQLMKTKKGDWSINSGILFASIKGNLTLEKINLNANFSIQSPQLNFPNSLSDWQKSLANSINQQPTINFNLIANGTIENPNIKLTSSIEKLFQHAIKDKVKQKAQKLTGKVQSAIAEKIGDMSKLNNFNSHFSQWEKQLTNKDELLSGLLNKIKF